MSTIEQVHFAEAVMKAPEAALQQYAHQPPKPQNPEEYRRLARALIAATDQYKRLLKELDSSA